MRRIILVTTIVVISISGCKGQANEDNIFGSDQYSLQSNKPFELFSLQLHSATHEQLNKQLIVVGARLLGSDSFSDSFVDYYDPKKIFNDAVSMKASYAKSSNKFYQIDFYFPKSNSLLLLNKLTSRFGYPDKSEVDKNRNYVFALWIYKDVTVRIDNTFETKVELSIYNINSQDPSPRIKEQKNIEHGSLVELFGVKLDSATREELRSALVKAGMQPVELEKNDWNDVYKAEKTLSGASKFEIIYTSDNHLAACEYTMPSFMDKYQINRVIELISEKYGKPNYLDGNVEAGPVNVKWKIGNISIFASRDWPDTTTYLTYINTDKYDQFAKEADARKVKTIKNDRERKNNAI